MFVGFWSTFLIQHSVGLDGMPRRVYEYPDVGHLELYNLISTVGSFILALGILVTVVNVVRSACKQRRRSPGPTRGRATRSSGSRTSPPPVNNFDVVPRVRSVEPMKDIRRQIERQTGTPVEPADRAEPRPAAGRAASERSPMGVAAQSRHATPAARRAASGRSSPTTSR